MIRREFRRRHGLVNEYWLIDLEPLHYTTYTGLVGEMGRSRRRRFATADEARAAFERAIQRKRREGYVEIEPDANLASTAR